MCQSVGNMEERVCGGVETYTPSGHVVGMLDRDQRTAKVPTYPKHPECSGTAERSPSRAGCGKVPHSWKSRGWLSRVRETAQRLKQVLVVGTYLLSIVSIPSSLSAPTGLSMADRRSSHPKWINPCGIKNDDKDNLPDSYMEIPQVSAPELLTQIIAQANIALTKANQFKEDYTEKIHHLDSISLQDLWKGKRYGWLPTLEEIPKSLGEIMPENSNHMADLEFDDTLVDIYEHLQKIAVGLEAIVWDQEDERGLFLKNFTDTEYNLRSLLCEIQMAIIERGLTQKPDITRDVMSEELRHLTDTTSRYFRDWLIYRDYMNALEYTIQAFSHIRNTL